SLGFVSPTPVVAQEARARKQVLVLHYYSDVLPLVRLVDQGVRTTLHRERFDYTIEHLDFTHFPDSDYRQTIADYLRRKYQRVRVDALVVVSDPMLAFLRDHPDLFPSVPVVAAVEQRNGPDAGTGRETGRMDSGEDIYGTAQLALTLHPRTQHPFVVGSIVRDKLAHEAEVRHQLEPIARSIDVTLLNSLSQDQMADRLRTLPRQSAVIYLRYFRDLVPRQTFSDVFERLAKAANAPVYGVYDVQIGRGAVGGYTLDSEGLGKRVAELAIDLANGRRVSNASDLRAPRVLTFDGRQLQRWGIAEGQLPAGHIVQFRQVSLWEQYRGYIVGAISLVAIQMMLIAGLLVQRARRQRSEDALRQSEARNRAMLWALPDLMFVQNSDGVYLDYHAKDSSELLLPPEQFLGKSMKEVLPPELAEKFGRCLTDGTGSRELRGQEYSLTIGGEVKHYEARIVPDDGDKVLSIIRDITERQRALDALRQSEERFSKVFMASPLPIAVTTIEEGRYLAVNESFLMMSGYARDEVVGRTATELGNWSSPEVRSELVR